MKVKVGDLADAIELELQNYSDEVREDMAESFKKIAVSCVKKLRATSPKRSQNSKGYSKSWTQTVTVTPHKISASVYNKKFYSLTHLLENGHAKADGGRVLGIPHISPVQEWAADEAVEELTKILERT